jgi:hypothetical protein
MAGTVCWLISLCLTNTGIFGLAVENGGKDLDLCIVVPLIFSDHCQYLYTSVGDDDFNQNTNKGAVFEQQCKMIVKNDGVKIHGSGDNNDDLEIGSSKQLVWLPFKVETKCHYISCCTDIVIPSVFLANVVLVLLRGPTIIVSNCYMQLHY